MRPRHLPTQLGDVSAHQRKGSDVATRERAAGAGTRRARQKAGRVLIGSPSGGGGLPHVSSATSDLVLKDAQAREQRIKDIVLWVVQQQSSYPEFPTSLSLSHSQPFISIIAQQSVRDESGNFRDSSAQRRSTFVHRNLVCQ